ncbi:MAG: hypothetical protein ACJA1E_000152 [Paracoccaceae bacterium]|jgi:flagellar hook-length control protein FliK
MPAISATESFLALIGPAPVKANMPSANTTKPGIGTSKLSSFAETMARQNDQHASRTARRNDTNERHEPAKAGKPDALNENPEKGVLEKKLAAPPDSDAPPHLNDPAHQPGVPEAADDSAQDKVALAPSDDSSTDPDAPNARDTLPSEEQDATMSASLLDTQQDQAIFVVNAATPPTTVIGKGGAEDQRNAAATDIPLPATRVSDDDKLTPALSQLGQANPAGTLLTATAIPASGSNAMTAQLSAQDMVKALHQSQPAPQDSALKTGTGALTASVLSIPPTAPMLATSIIAQEIAASAAQRQTDARTNPLGSAQPPFGDIASASPQVGATASLFAAQQGTVKVDTPLGAAPEPAVLSAASKAELATTTVAPAAVAAPQPPPRVAVVDSQSFQKIDADIQGLTTTETRISGLDPLTSSRASLSTNLAPQVSGQLITAMRTSNGAPVELALHPEELGRIRMSFNQSETGLVISISADRPETSDLMRRHIEQFARDMAKDGFKDVTFDFGDAPKQDQNAQDTFEHMTGRGDGDDTATGMPPLNERALQPSVRDNTAGISGLDLRM